jgi:hypothetical protein
MSNELIAAIKLGLLIVVFSCVFYALRNLRNLRKQAKADREEMFDKMHNRETSE